MGSPADLLSSSKSSSSLIGEEHSTSTSGSRPGSRTQVTSFLDDIADSFDEENSQTQFIGLGRSRTNSPYQAKEEDFKKPLDYDKNHTVSFEDAFEKKVKEYTNDSDGENTLKEANSLS